MTSPMLPSLLTTERTYSELQGLMTASNNWTEAADFAEFEGGDIFSPPFYGAHGYLFESDYLDGYTSDGVMQSQLNTAYPTSFDSTSGSSYSEDIDATYYQTDGQTALDQAYNDQLYQNMMSMGMDSVAHRFLDPAMLFEQPNAEIYAGAATETEATGSFPTQSTYPQAGHIDAFSYASLVDVPAVEGAFDLSPTSSQNLLATQCSVERYPVAKASPLYDEEQLDDVLHPFRKAQPSVTPHFEKYTHHSGGIDLNPSYNEVEAPLFNLAADMSPSSLTSELGALYAGWKITYGDGVSFVIPPYRGPVESQNASTSASNFDDVGQEPLVDIPFKLNADAVLDSILGAEIAGEADARANTIMPHTHFVENRPAVHSYTTAYAGNLAIQNSAARAGIDDKNNSSRDLKENQEIIPATYYSLSYNQDVFVASEFALNGSAHERDGLHISTQSEKLNDTTNICYSTKRATQNLNLSVETSLSKGKKRAIDDLEDEARQKNTSPSQKRSSRDRESSGVPDASAIPSEHPDLRANAAGPTPRFAAPGPSDTDTESSAAAPGIIAAPDASPTLLQTSQTALAAQPQVCASTPLRCHFCVASGTSSNTYSRKAELNRHLKQKHTIGGVPCQLCGVTLSNEFAVARHIKTKACKSFKQ